MKRILALWATPRSTSTAFEWMMRQRRDFHCLHEPFNEVYYYGEDRRSQRDAHVAPRPGLSFAAVWRAIREQARTRQVFFKEFAYSVAHMIDEDLLAPITHSFLVREPRKVLAGLNHHWPDFTVREAGFVDLWRLFERVAERDGKAPPVIDSADLVSRPAATVRAYCAAVGIPFVDSALSWEAGERREVSWYGEGAGPWHDGLRGSTGISEPGTVYPPLEDCDRLMRLLETCAPIYDALLAHRLAVDAPGGSSG